VTPGGHPTDADREQRAAPVLAAAVRALQHADGAALAALLRDDAAWLAPDGRSDGPAAATARARAVAIAGREWADPQIKGAHAVLRWTDSDGGSRGALVVEVRGEHLVLVCETP
jgi:hypothetical protein